jgi:hypothetical protein
MENQPSFFKIDTIFKPQYYLASSFKFPFPIYVMKSAYDKKAVQSSEESGLYKYSF